MKKCGWCGADTLEIYTLNDGKSLCPICAEKHYNFISNRMTNHIREVNNGLKNRRDNLRKLKQKMCNHENLIDTGYAKHTENMGWVAIYRCKDCDKEIFKSAFPNNS